MVGFGKWKLEDGSPDHVIGGFDIHGIERRPVYNSQKAGNYHVPSAVRWA